MARSSGRDTGDRVFGAVQWRPHSCLDDGDLLALEFHPLFSVCHFSSSVSARLSDAAMIGGAIGVAFLAHPVPAVFLATITTIAACTIHGLRLRTFAWLAVACFTALVVGAPFLLPLVVTYRLREVNLAPSHFIGGLGQLP